MLLRLFWLVEHLEMFLATSGSPGMFVNTWKNDLKLWRLFRTCKNSRKISSNFRKSWNVCKYLEKYSEAFETLMDL